MAFLPGPHPLASRHRLFSVTACSNPPRSAFPVGRWRHAYLIITSLSRIGNTEWKAHALFFPGTFRWVLIDACGKVKTEKVGRIPKAGPGTAIIRYRQERRKEVKDAETNEDPGTD
jgi:hypothetical protein